MSKPIPTKTKQLKDHELALLINELTKVAQEDGQLQCIRVRVRDVVLKHLKPLQK